ncbi:bifunctional isocitrate dehydrogenase kinase/phosphatase [Neisseria montereyensis]|uniref:Isocitrate dehydrogenase kinase/phosphatase n=1 Tax=Neisseria montereyensis TaxID=2973938 RepID=A0ABT2FFG4_9NEIS|nr:bifunctional isocitrate dehydrogenase kinase/phosphatase [Neisseria montereyensis]MCS4534225.1 bifunctional isocitrate dehydrogenase kinase/phosphatase [Neisseria montereyensis]
MPRQLTQQLGRAVAETMLAGFNKHYRLYREVTARAKEMFEQRNWRGIQDLVAERIQMYDQRVMEAVEALRNEHAAAALSDEVWATAKTEYIALLVNHKQPELAETFFNSVSTKLLAKEYYNNQFIFVKPSTSTEYIDSDPPTFCSFYPDKQGLRGCLRNILHHFDWQVPFAHMSKDIADILRAARDYFKAEWPPQEMNLHVQVLHAPFYRNKGAYVFGQIVNGGARHPFALAILHDDEGRLKIDAALFDAQQIAVLFSFARAYFLVDMPVPSAYIHFLHEMLPMRAPGDLYTMVGLHKQGKNIWWREFAQHLEYSHDKFILAPGIKGLVMSVFTLPSFPYVFKVIKDTFGPNKDFDQAYVREKYLLVKKHDRVGRMADTLEFTNVALPKDRCDEEFLNEMRTLAPSQFEETEDRVVIKHVYVEYRLKPLNLFMQKAKPTDKAAAVIDYGYALKELASANIFPGDMLYKNFGMTRFGRVIFYDYDEIEYMTDCNFRKIPPAPNPEYEMSGEVWYPVNKGDVFPEEFGPFLLGEPDVRKVFLEHHKDLLSPEFWQGKKERLEAGLYDDFYPYPQSVRFNPDKVAAGVADDADA